MWNSFSKKKREHEKAFEEKADTSKLEELPPEPKHSLNKKGKVTIKNIYDKGFFGNYWEVLSPPSFRQNIQTKKEIQNTNKRKSKSKKSK